MPWIIWLAAAAALGVAEFFAPALAWGLLAVAAVVAAVVAGLGGPLLAQILAFAITGAAALLIVRPIARRHMSHPPLVRDGSDALIGKTGGGCGGGYRCARSYQAFRRAVVGSLV